MRYLSTHLGITCCCVVCIASIFHLHLLHIHLHSQPSSSISLFLYIFFYTCSSRNLFFLYSYLHTKNTIPMSMTIATSYIVLLTNPDFLFSLRCQEILAHMISPYIMLLCESTSHVPPITCCRNHHFHYQYLLFSLHIWQQNTIPFFLHHYVKL